MTADNEGKLGVPVAEKVRLIQERVQPVIVREEQVQAYSDGGFKTGFEVCQVAGAGEPFVRYSWERGHRSAGTYVLRDTILEPGYVGLYIRNIDNVGLDNSRVATHSDWSRLRRAVKGRLRHAGFSQQMPGFRF